MYLKKNYLLVIIALTFCFHSVLNAQETDQIKEGIDLIQKKEYEKAITFFDRAVKLNKQKTDYYYWLGKAYEGTLEDAGLFSIASIASKMRSNYEKAIEIDPDNIEARYELAKFFNNGSPLLGGSDSEAQKQLKEIQKRDPLKGYELSAYFYWYDAEWEPAIQEYLKYVKNDTTNAEVYSDMAICYLQIGDYGHAFDSFKTSIRINPDNDEAHFYLGRLYLKQGKKELARKEYETAVQINPEKESYKKALNDLK